MTVIKCHMALVMWLHEVLLCCRAVKTIIAESCDATNQAKAMGYMTAGWGLYVAGTSIMMFMCVIANDRVLLQMIVCMTHSMYSCLVRCWLHRLFSNSLQQDNPLL